TAARQGFARRRVVLFQPHRYTRTFHLFEEFLAAFDDADVLIVTDIYPAGEPPIPGVHARSLADGIAARSGRDVRYVGDRTEVVETLLRTIRPGDLVLTLGAGDVGGVADQVRERLGTRGTSPLVPGGEGDQHAG